MIEPEVEIDESKPFAVELNFNFEAYWSAYQSKSAEGKNEFSRHREEYISYFGNLNGNLLWFDIKTTMLRMCKQDVPWQKKLSTYLSNPQGPQPLVLECLDLYFIEFVKNSCDNLLKRLNTGQSVQTKLCMNVSLEVVDGYLTVHIEDDAGGFSKAYLSDKKPSIKHTDPNLFFGGANEGLWSVQKFLCKEDLRCEGMMGQKMFDSPSFQIENGPAGAILHLKSAFLPALTPTSPLKRNQFALFTSVKERKILCSEESLPDPKRPCLDASVSALSQPFKKVNQALFVGDNDKKDFQLGPVNHSSIHQGRLRKKIKMLEENSAKMTTPKC